MSCRMENPAGYFGKKLFINSVNPKVVTVNSMYMNLLFKQLDLKTQKKFLLIPDGY